MAFAAAGGTFFVSGVVQRCQENSLRMYRGGCGGIPFEERFFDAAVTKSVHALSSRKRGSGIGTLPETAANFALKPLHLNSNHRFPQNVSTDGTGELFV